MISSLTFAPSTQAARPAAPAKPAEQPTPAPSPLPDPPADSVNFDSIDTPVKAALHPVMDPGILTAIVGGALFGSAPHGAIATASVLTGTSAQPPAGGSISNQITETFIFSGKDQPIPVTEGGLQGDVFDSGKLTIDVQKNVATWTQLPGTELNLVPDDKTGALHIDGHLGSVETHLTANQIEKGLPNDTFGIHSEGKLGDQAFSSDTLFTVTSFSQHKDAVTANISTKGKLGDADIQKDYQVSGMIQDDSHAQLTVHGQGVVAGVPVKIDAEAHIAN